MSLVIVLSHHSALRIFRHAVDYLTSLNFPALIGCVHSPSTHHKTFSYTPVCLIVMTASCYLNPFRQVEKEVVQIWRGKGD